MSIWSEREIYHGFNINNNLDNPEWILCLIMVNMFQSEILKGIFKLKLIAICLRTSLCAHTCVSSILFSQTNFLVSIISYFTTMLVTDFWKKNLIIVWETKRI